MKKILLLFTSFLFTSNLTLFGAASFEAQADKKAKQSKAKQLTFYQKLKQPLSASDIGRLEHQIAGLFLDEELSLVTPTPAADKKIRILTNLLAIINQDKQLQDGEYPNYLFALLEQSKLQLAAKEQRIQQEQAAKEAERLRRQQESEQHKRQAQIKREQSEARKAQKEALEWEETAKKNAALVQTVKDLVAARSKPEEKSEQQSKKPRAGKMQKLPSAENRAEKEFDELSITEGLITGLAKRVKSLEAFKERATDQLLVQVRADYLKTLNGLRNYYFDPIIIRLQEQGQLTPEVKEPLDRVIALINAKIETANELTTQDFLAMEENALLLELDAHIQNVPGLTHPQGNFALMAFYMDWKESLKRFKHPCIPVQLL